MANKVKKSRSQIEMLVAPKSANQLVRLQDLLDALAEVSKSPVLAATTGSLGATYNGASKTLTSVDSIVDDGSGNPTPYDLEIDEMPIAVGDRILVKDQADKTQNGIYVLTLFGAAIGDAAFVLTRAEDYDRSSELISGGHIQVSQGTSNSGEWKLSSPKPLILDSSNLEFTRVTSATKVEAADYAIVGDGVKDVFDFSHSWGTYNVGSWLYDASTHEEVIADIQFTSVNDVRVGFGVAPAVGENYLLVLMTVLKNKI
jgi:hypothetical protein